MARMVLSEICPVLYRTVENPDKFICKLHNAFSEQTHMLVKRNVNNDGSKDSPTGTWLIQQEANHFHSNAPYSASFSTCRQSTHHSYVHQLCFFCDSNYNIHESKPLFVQFPLERLDVCQPSSRLGLCYICELGDRKLPFVFQPGLEIDTSLLWDCYHILPFPWSERSYPKFSY